MVEMVGKLVKLFYTIMGAVFHLNGILGLIGMKAQANQKYK
jgi:hypothetical protein